LIEAYQRAIVNAAAALTFGGWVRGDQYDDLVQRVYFDPLSSKNPFSQRFAPLLGSFGLLHKRCANQPLKAAVSNTVGTVEARSERTELLSNLRDGTGMARHMPICAARDCYSLPRSRFRERSNCVATRLRFNL
jgi:hypothetical protein